MTSNFSVSVIISTHNRHEALDNLLSDLSKQSIQSQNFEVILVDSIAGIDPTPVMEKYATDGMNIRLLIADNILAAKRNAGAKSACGDVLIFLDDDLRVNPELVESFRKSILNNPGTVQSGQIRFPLKWINRSNYYLYKNSRHMNDSNVSNDSKNRTTVAANHVVAMSFAIRKEDYERIGGFDERFVMYGGEDVEFGCRVIRSGLDARYEPNAISYHYEIKTSVSVFASKIYRASFNGTPLLLEYAPESKDIKSFTWTEPGLYRSWKDQVVYASVRAMNTIHLLKPTIYLLESVDGKRLFYLPIAYKIVTLLAMNQAALDRLRGHKSRSENLIIAKGL